MTSLTLYATITLDSTLTNACDLVTVTGASASTPNHTVIGTNSGWGSLGFGANPTWPSNASPGPANGFGAIWNVTTLEGMTFPAGTWTLKTNVTCQAASSSETGVLELMLYVYNGGTYTSIGTATIASATYTTTATSVAISGSFGAVTFATGDRLYYELWFHSTSHTGTPVNMLVTTSNSATLGFAGAGELDTPGYSPVGSGLSVTMGGAGTLTATLTAPVITSSQPYGVTIGNASGSGSLNSGAITDMLNLGMTWLRYQVNWSSIDATGTTNQNASTYAWGAYDSAVSQCNTAGIHVVLSVMKPPAQFSTSGNPMTPGYTATFAAQIAARYNGGAHGTIDGIEFNEDYNYGSDNLTIPDPDVTALIATVKAVYPAVKAVNGSMLCGVPCKLQRNSTGYTDWFDTLLKPSTGLYDASGNFLADYLNFHYYTCGPSSGGNPVSLDPTVDIPSWNGGQGLPSITHAWQIIRDKMTQYGVSLPVWLTEFGFQININPGRNAACTVSQATQWTYTKAIIDSLRTSGGVVDKCFIFTLGYYTGYGTGTSARDGMSLVQGSLTSPIYTTAYNSLKTYTATYPTWTGGGTALSLAATIAGHGTLSGTLATTGGGTLSSQLSGVGALTGMPSLSTTTVSGTYTIVIGGRIVLGGHLA